MGGARGFGKRPGEKTGKYPAPVRQALAAAARELAAGRWLEAGDHYHRILESLQPDCPEALAGLGGVLLQLEKYAAAAHLLERAVALQPGDGETHRQLGTALIKLSRPQEAATHFEQAIALSPTSAPAHNGLALALQALGNSEQAAVHFREAMALNPDWIEPPYHLGWILLNQGQLEAAGRCYETVLAARPDLAGAHTCLGIVRQNQGEAESALVHYRRALELAPDAATHTCLLLSLQYRDDLAPEQWCAALADFAHFCRTIEREEAPPNVPDPDRRLRIGYLGPDFRTHSCAWFIEPLLAAHDRQAFEIFCYADVLVPDAVTARLQKLVLHWRPTAGEPDEAVARQIRSDRIDILVDLAGHTSGNRLTLFARKVAPLQVSWLGFPGSTGLSAIDYRLSDRWLSPPETPEFFAEALWNLERPVHCYRPHPQAPVAGALPALTLGRITFGSFNKITKIAPATVELWAAVLTALPTSRLMLKTLQAGEPAARQRLEAAFIRHGIEPGRIFWLETLPDPLDHLACYQQIDIALDTYPYNGATTTLEALWMGVPVISLVGERTASRYGLSLLSALGLQSLAAATPEEFVQAALGLATDLEKLCKLRNALRGRMQASVLCDEANFAQAVESAFRQMWRLWCKRRS
ncbi:tetratricopeptide repeat protein [Gloeobacter kilaueensis]|uniref:protein O-GlcNAc transferase n=1 Tax=Gloeobacter kilaueensis (strain ATCC BAA-2537 / CCAP 1431/1 / ULC 316 / JS1) TaxID=1183438 RepID=U5QJM2_GLOK1|nr:tetratricopeptide repeat protein [Gloeobacter kilaueensis]AGY59088.1 TPR repeat-containing protein [Gloeobacter kilaueensis JS1]